jgi:hypothetical protein
MARTQHGYGKYDAGGITYRSHRIAYFLTHGDIADDICILHRCDRPSCNNPRHLFAGTQTDNMQDCVSKGRYNPLTVDGLPKAKGKGIGKGPRGMDQWEAKLTDDGVVKIRELYASGSYRHMDLALMFSVSKSVIGKVCRRESWKHVTSG